MKKNFILFLIMVALPLELYGQGTFLFRNKAVNAPLFDANGSLLSGANYMAELYGSATTNNLSPTLDVNSYGRIIVPFLSGDNAGFFSSSKSHTVFEITPGGFAWLQVRAWDSRLGASYEDVVASGLGGYGESGLFYARGGDPTLLPAETPQLLIGLQSFNLRPVVPEPTVLAIVSMGIFGLSWRVRKRQ